MAKVEIEIGGFRGTGSTLKAARESAQSQAHAALTGDYSPKLHRFGSMLLLLWREPKTGWHSKWIIDWAGEEASGRLWGSSMDDDPARLLDAAKIHAAQQQWRHDGTDDPPAWLTDKRQLSDWRGWVQFQRKYREGTAAGLNDDQAHKYAGGWYATIDDARIGRR